MFVWFLIFFFIDIPCPYTPIDREVLGVHTNPLLLLWNPRKTIKVQIVFELWLLKSWLRACLIYVFLIYNCIYHTNNINKPPSPSPFKTKTNNWIQDFSWTLTIKILATGLSYIQSNLPMWSPLLSTYLY